jgi:hypothetical protein
VKRKVLCTMVRTRWGCWEYGMRTYLAGIEPVAVGAGSVHGCGLDSMARY